MLYKKVYTICLIALAFTLISPGLAFAFPPLPSSFYGAIKQNGENILEGTLVEALIDGKVMATSLTETYQGSSVYSLDIPGDDAATDKVEGGSPGQAIQFRVGGVLADQTAAWSSGVNQNLDLTLEAGKTLAPTQPTFTPVPSQTPIPHTTVTRAPTRTNTPETEQAAEGEKPPRTDSLTPTSRNHPTEAESQANPESPPKDPLQPTDEAVLAPEDASKRTAVSNAAVGEQIGFEQPETDKSATASPFLTSEAQPQDAAAKGGTLAWIGLPALLLVGIAATILTLRQKKKSGRESPML